MDIVTQAPTCWSMVFTQGSWYTHVQIVHESQGEKRKLFAQLQEAIWKDIEQCFGVL